MGSGFKWRENEGGEREKKGCEALVETGVDFFLDSIATCRRVGWKKNDPKEHLVARAGNLSHSSFSPFECDLNI